MTKKKIKISKKALAMFSAKTAIKQIDQTCKSLGMNRVERMLILRGIFMSASKRYAKLEKKLTNSQKVAVTKALATKKIVKVINN